MADRAKGMGRGWHCLDAQKKRLIKYIIKDCLRKEILAVNLVVAVVVVHRDCERNGELTENLPIRPKLAALNGLHRSKNVLMCS